MKAMLDTVTAVSATGPAPCSISSRHWSKRHRARHDESTALEFALQTFLGSAQLAAHSDEAPAVLRQRVTSKRGTAGAPLKAFDAQNEAALLAAGVAAACERSRELGGRSERGNR
ncbi:MAG: hypothetical protein IPP88_18675 [Betaproteobacteria bacterium]|nr:hypothetical protein [Betaproteobacteria bacterium]